MLASNSLLEHLANFQLPDYPSVTGLRQTISARSLAEFFAALAWSWALLVSFTGWGRACGRIFRVPRLPASIACALGIATLIFIGSVLNLLHAIYAPVLIALIAIGWGLYFISRQERPQPYQWKQFWTQSSIRSRAFIVAMLIILAFRVAATVRLAEFNVSDDSAAYLALAKKTLSSHHLAVDPFSERRNTSSLGGAYFLQDIILSATSLSNIGMADRTVGLLLLVAVTFDLGIAFELSPFQISFMELLIVLIPQETFNLTFIILPVPLLLVMMWILFQATKQEAEGRLRYALLAGMVGGAAISLKSTYLPIVAALSTMPYFLPYFSRRPKRALNLLLSTGAGIVVVLMFWMVAMKLDSGSYLFPVLGRGIDYSAFGLFHPATRFPTRRSLIKVVLQGAVLLFLAGLQMLPRPRTKLSLFSVSILVSAALAVIAFNYTSGADYIWRYNFPQVFSAVIVFCAASLAIGNSGRQSQLVRLVGCVGITALASMIFYYDIAGKKPRPFHTEISEATNWQPLYAGMSGRSLTAPQLKAGYLQLERSIPEDGRVLENVAYSFLLNYRSHSIYIMDWPGASAPSPGWPFGAHPAQLAGYLQRNSIRYLILDHRYMLLNDAEMCQDLQKPHQFSVLLRQHLWLNILADHQLNQILERYRVIYDDGSIGVVDLTRPVSGNLSPASSWNVDTNLDAVCSMVAANYFAGRSRME